MPSKPLKSRLAREIQARLSAKKEAGTTPFVGAVRFAKEADPETGLRSIEIVGNSGTPFNYAGEDIVVDFKRSSVAAQVPILRDHDTSRILGHTTRSTKSLVATGVLSGQKHEVEEVTTMADNGYPWQSSIYLDTEGYESYDDDHKDKIEVNGQKYKAPLLVVWGRVREYTICSLGADENTSSTFFSWKPNMADELDVEQVDDETDLELSDEADETDDESLDDDTDLELSDESEDDDTEEDDVEDELELAVTNRIRQASYITQIEKVAAKYGASESDIAKALTAKLSADQFEICLLRRSRPTGKHLPAKDAVKSELAVLEAACYLAAGINDPSKIALKRKPSDDTFQKAEDEYGLNIGFSELFAAAARLNGHTGRQFQHFKRNPRAVLKAAFSTHELSGVLSNVTSTLIRNAYMGQEQVWRRVAKVGSLTDFKTHTRYALTGDMTFEKVGPTGEMKHGTWGEESYSASLETYAKMFSLTRKDLINDDLGVLSQLAARLGRGAGLAVNEVFWTAFLADHSTDFTTARKNYMEGAGTTLSVEQLSAADVIIGTQTDPDGKPYFVSMDRLLVPRALKTKAGQINRDTSLSYGADDETLVHTSNPWAGQFEVLSSVYLGNSAMGGGYSTTAWYLLGDPDSLPYIEMNFLNGRQEPVVESTDVDFDQLGIQTRGYFDFKPAKVSYRAAFKSKGAA